MTAQELFDKTISHLLAQGGQSTIETAEHGYTNTILCRYRAPNGRRCAVGVHITDEFYTPKMEGMSANCTDVGDILAKQGLAEHQMLLFHLQRDLHDRIALSMTTYAGVVCYDWTTDVLSHAVPIAERYGLVMRTEEEYLAMAFPQRSTVAGVGEESAQAPCDEGVCVPSKG